MKIMPTNYNYINQAQQHNKTQKTQAFKSHIEINTDHAEISAFTDAVARVYDSIVNTIKSGALENDTAYQGANSILTKLTLPKSYDSYKEQVNKIIEEWKKYYQATDHTIRIQFVSE